MLTDPIADMLTRIRNASRIHKKEVAVPFSNIKMAIAQLLVREGYLVKADEVKDVHKSIVLTLKYDQGEPAIHEINRVSKPGSRQYIKHDQIKNVLNGYGIAVLSTPQGVMTNKDALKARLGGELMCEVF
jgi:small subunit ribosomal protein S8